MRVHRLLTIALLGLVTLGTPALGGVSLDYYLPADTEFDEGIPTPEEFLGYQIGEWHVSHDQLVAYVRELARTSDRVRIEEYARSHEKRPLVVLTITSPENHDRLQQIQQQHLTLSDPSASATAPLEQMPVVAYMGYSIHGNEASGSNAAPLVAYWLAAAQGDQVEGLLRDAVILLDPSYNPDGLSRFTYWANMHRGRQLVADPAHREHTEAWPQGRFNHYWFDLIDAAPDSVFAPRPYAMLDQDRGAQVIGGAIFSTDVDYTHPLGFGYGPDPLPVLRRGGLFFRPADNPYATPVRYSADALLSGYISLANAELLAGSAGVVVVAVGKGRVVLIADELAFRAFWFGTNKLIANAVFFAPIVDHAAASIKR